MAKVKNVDEYIAQTENTFAHPYLQKLRGMINETAPQAAENIKWGAPAFEYKGIMLTLVSFKNAVSLWFHKGALLNDPQGLLEASSETTKSMRKYTIPRGEQIKEDALRALIAEAVLVQDSGEQVAGFNKARRQYDNSPVLMEALKEDELARKTFDELSEARQYEFIEHIESAKQAATRERRCIKSLEILRQGMGLHDKYKK